MQVEDARQDPTIIKMIEPLEKVGGQASRHAHELRVITSGAQAEASTGDWPMVALGDMMSGPGGRHDNDKVDFRSISIQPTADEVSMLWTRHCQPCKQSLDRLYLLLSPL